MILLRTLTFAENWLGIYRNYSCVSKKFKFFVILLVTVQICVSFAVAGNHIASVYSNNKPREVIVMFYLFGLFILMKNMVITIGGIANSGSYKILLKSVSSLDKRFKNEPSYSRSEKKLKRKCLAISILFVTLVILISSYRINKGFFSLKHRLAGAVFLAIYDFWVDIRYMLEHLVIYCAITLICKHLKCLNKFVQELLKKYKSNENTEIFLDINEDIDNSKKLSYWAEGYQDILTSSKQISKCFNGLMFFSLAVAILRTVWSVFEIISLLVVKSFSMRTHLNEILFNIVYHMGATITLLYAGQKLQNGYCTLKISLASLANQVSIYDQKEVIRSLRDLNRIVTTNPIVIKFGNFTLGMYLLPMILSLSATYIVTVLQFNHVI